MDSVRFGRALGIGARSAATALAAAVDAATTPNPTPAVPRQTAPSSDGVAWASPPISKPDAAAASEGRSTRIRQSFGPVGNAAHSAARATIGARKAGAGVARGGRRFGEAVWGPLVTVSGILWLEITGAFFGLFALFASQAAWTHRADLSFNANRDGRIRACVFLAMAVAFGYFCVSSFVRARRRTHRT